MLPEPCPQEHSHLPHAAPHHRAGRGSRDERGCSRALSALVSPSPGLTCQLPHILSSKDLSALTALPPATPTAGSWLGPSLPFLASHPPTSCLSAHSLCDLDTHQSLPPEILDPLSLVLPLPHLLSSRGHSLIPTPSSGPPLLLFAVLAESRVLPLGSSAQAEEPPSVTTGFTS